jgi:SAM-dependent methyltransferase
MTTGGASGQDEAKAQAFAQRMLGVMIGGRLTLMLSIGHDTGLFDALATLPPATSAQIADAAGLNERYVREWLGSVTTGGIVEYQSESQTYRLPPEHARVLTRAGEIRNFAGAASTTLALTRNYDAIVECFRAGGGVPYDRHERFTRQFAEASSRIHEAALLQRTLPAIPGIVERLRAGIDVADIGCGHGRAVNLMAGAFPNSRFTGFDFVEADLAIARTDQATRGLTNARFQALDVATLNLESAFDFITAFDAIHDQVAPAQVLANIARALRPGGTFLMVDIAASSNLEGNLSHPTAPSLYAASVMHCMTVSLAYGGAGLGTMWGEELARTMLAEAGFTAVEVRRVDGDYLNNYFVARRD